MPSYHHKTFAALISVVLSVVAGAGCAGQATTIEQSWSAPGTGQARFQRVVALYQSEVGTVRNAAEDQLVRRLYAQGVQAVPAYQVLSGDDGQNLERAKAKLRTAGYDGLVVMRMVDVSQNIEASPGGYDGWWGSPYGGYWGGYYSPYVYTETVVRIETAAYSLADDKLVWSALSKTIDPDDTRELVDDVTKVVANELGKRGIVASREVAPAKNPPTSL